MQNIADAQIDSQIRVLNKDFRATNTDRKKVPAPWKGLASDARVEFTLHDVTRTKTSKVSFGISDDVKKASSGGVPPVDPKKFLNLWVCALGGGLLGYAQFPGGPVKTDGVVINYRAAREIAVQHARGQATTEDLRQAMVHYRALFVELLETPQVKQDEHAAPGAHRRY